MTAYQQEIATYAKTHRKTRRFLIAVTEGWKPSLSRILEVPYDEYAAVFNFQSTHGTGKAKRILP